jgi:hypothetical protein
MSALDAFLEASLGPADAMTMVKSFQLAVKYMGRSRCWCMKSLNHAAFEGYTTSHTTGLTYRGRDARPLLMALSGQYPEEGREMVVRRSSCSSKYCLNPSHYYWGTKSDVALENRRRRSVQLDAALIQRLRQEWDAGSNASALSKKYALPYQMTRRICNRETFEEVAETKKTDNLSEIWTHVDQSIQQLISDHPQAARQFEISYHVSNELQCPWHRKGSTKHKGNFGLMGECLDCMEELQKNRCTVDVRNFDYKWYWQVRRFWEQVDIRGQDECWPWLGATRKNNTESIAYFPSPFHSGKTQSASRVAFWLSRGYTGKYRIFSKKECSPFCCNPKHLTIRELKNFPEPSGIETIQLNHDNIFEHTRKAHAEEE